MSGDRDLDAVVVGAGFAGLYALHRLRNELGLRVRVFETAAGVGGTWYWNCYPGARCDIESVDYSYSFSPELEQEWSWSERYPGQPELLRYLNHVADRFDLRPDIQLETTVVSAAFDEDARRWVVTTDRGERHTAQFCLLAVGCLSAANVPALPGLESFAGRRYHTGDWPQEGVDFTGERVGVIGTGSSGIQVIPELAGRAAHVTVFQRTANFSVPSRNRPTDPDEERAVKQRYPAFREAARASFLGVSVAGTGRSALEVGADEARAVYEERWARGGGMPVLTAFTDLLVDERANATAAEFVRAKIREAVTDPEVAEALVPRGFPIGAKRLCQHGEYWEVFNRDDVTLVDLRRSPIEQVTPTGIRTADADHALDAIVFATGFDAVTGALLKLDVRGRDGVALRDTWAHGPSAYLGLAIAGFPNLFVITGPGSPSVLSNVVVSIEQHVEWIGNLIAHLRARGVELIEASAQAQAAWVDHVNEVADATLFPRAESWYVGANIPGKPRVFTPYVGGVGRYRARCDEVAANGYEGFELTPA